MVIRETLKFLISRLDFPTSEVAEDLLDFLQLLNCPFNLNKSLLKVPAVPNRWPTFLAIIHWLVQISRYKDRLASSADSKSLIERDCLYSYTLNSYSHYIKGDDDAVKELDQECWKKLEREKRSVEEKLKATTENVARLEIELVELRSRPTKKEALEKKSLLEDDANKLRWISKDWKRKIEDKEKDLGKKEKQLDAKVQANKSYCEENEELKKTFELQTFNAWYVERIKKELEAVERDIGKAELARNDWEEVSSDLNTTLELEFKNLETPALDCNQALKRLILAYVQLHIVFLHCICWVYIHNNANKSVEE